MRYLFFITLFFVAMGQVNAQDTTRQDTTAHVDYRKVKKTKYFRDTIHRERRKFDSTLFTNITIPSTSDFAEDLERIYQMLDRVPVITESFSRLSEIDSQLDQEDAALDILKDRLSQSDRTLNIRNLQMFNTLLDELARNVKGYTSHLNEYDTTLDKIRAEIAGLKKDTLILHVFRDTALKNTFRPQLQQLKDKWRQVDSLITLNGQEINTLKSQASAHIITIGELQYRVDAELRAVGSKAFGKERRYLWEPRGSSSNYSKDNLKKSLDGEQQLARYYFSNTKNKRLWLLLTGFIFFFWVWFNFRALRRIGELKAIEGFHFVYLNPYPIAGTLVFILSLAPLFDLHAPAIYIESIEFLLMVLLTILFRKRLPRNLFYAWGFFLFLFLLLPVIRILGLPLSLQRWANIVIDSVAVLFGFFFLFSRGRMPGKPRFISIAAGFYIFLNVLAVFCNLFGRVSLSQIFGATAIYSFAETVSMAVFVNLVVDSFLLQIQTSRVRKKYPESFDFAPVTRSISRVAIALASVIWLVVFATNLNIFDALNDLLVDVFTSPRQVGSIQFTLGGAVLFLGIIWLANFLQKFIAWFFGDLGDDAAFDDKGQRSRLVVTRLVLLIGGFLLAVAASGLPVDRITVILGALGVGIGLGLQSIVNNFVSGIILIFDRPLRIGDTVEVGDKKGRVKEIGIRSSTLLTEEGAEVIIPNGDVLSNHVVNWTLSNNHVRVALSFTIDTPANPDDIAPDAIREIVKADANVVDRRDPEILFNTLTSKTMEIKVFFWIKDISKSALTSGEIRTGIYRHLQKKGITVV
ncbi:MAG TPA: mechanosensitive ion channel domain-containing protein [Puia sp.]|jgi:small-conductance mechanosensitive channel